MIDEFTSPVITRDISWVQDPELQILESIKLEGDTKMALNHQDSGYLVI